MTICSLNKTIIIENLLENFRRIKKKDQGEDVGERMLVLGYGVTTSGTHLALFVCHHSNV